MVIALVQQIFSLFLMLGMGVLLVRFGGVRAEESRTLSALCIYVVTPCVIIHAFQIEYTRETMQGFILAILLAAAAHLLMFLISFVLQKPLQLTQVESLSIVYPNSGNLVIPLVAVILGSEWVIYASAFMSVQLFCIWTHGLSVISRQRKFDLQKILTNVNLLCVAGGFLLFLFQIKLPKVIDGTLASVSGMMGPVSMIMIGMMMAGISLTPIVKNRRIYFVAALRLIAIPLAAMLLLWLVKHALTAANAPQILLIILLALIMPPSSTVTQLAQLYQNDADYCGSINVLATLLSIATMPVMIALWEILP